jgi:hypothetical protein
MFERTPQIRLLGRFGAMRLLLLQERRTDFSS